MKNFKLIFAGFLIAFCGSAYAEIRCQEAPTENQPLANIYCANSGGNAEVIFRKMPAWGPNAGLVIVDMCRLQNKGSFPDLNGSLPYAWRQLSLNETIDWTLPDPKCVRRWCTDRLEYFRFAIDGLPIPFSSAIIGLSFAIENSDFEVRCETLPIAAFTPEGGADL